MRSVAFARPRHALEESRRIAESLGFEAFGVPSMEIIPRSEAVLEGFRDRVREGRYSALVFTSALAFRHFLGPEPGREALKGAIAKTEVVAIGPGTARELGSEGLPMEPLPPEHSSSGIVRQFGERLSGRRVGLIRSDKGTALLREGLREAGALVEEMHIYGSEAIRDSEEMRLLVARWRAEGLDALAFTSALTARYFLASARIHLDGEELGSLLSSTLVAAIGEPTAEGLRAEGVEPSLVSASADFKDLLEAIQDMLEPNPPDSPDGK